MRSGHRGLAAWLFVACGVWLVGLGGYFIFIRPALLPEDMRFANTSILLLQAAAPGIADWLRLVFTVMGGFMAGAGVLVVFLGWKVLPSRPKGAALALALTGGATVGLMSVVNFGLHSDFRWLLIWPVIGWVTALLLYVRPGRDSGEHG